MTEGAQLGGSGANGASDTGYSAWTATCRRPIVITSDGRGGDVATIDDGRAELLAGQARRMKQDSLTAVALLRDGQAEEAAELLRRVASYATFIAAWLEDMTQPPREPPMRGKSRHR